MPESSNPISSWRNYSSRYRLEGVRCQKCLCFYFPKKWRCVCGSDELRRYKFNGSGKILSFTQIFAAPHDFVHTTPYILGVIELEEGPRIVAQISDVSFQHVAIGLSVRAVLRKYGVAGSQGIINYGLKFIIQDAA